MTPAPNTACCTGWTTRSPGAPRRAIGLVSEERHAGVLAKYAAVEAELKRLESTYLPPSESLCSYRESAGTAAVRSGVSLADLLRRPQVDYKALEPFDPGRPALPRAVTEQTELSLKYEGYIRRQFKQVEEFTRLEERMLPEDIDYGAVAACAREARQKSRGIRPASSGRRAHLGREPGGVAALMIFQENRRLRQHFRRANTHDRTEGGALDKVVIGFSGGVDTAVSARSQGAGFWVFGLFLDTCGASPRSSQLPNGACRTP